MSHGLQERLSKRQLIRPNLHGASGVATVPKVLRNLTSTGEAEVKARLQSAGL